MAFYYHIEANATGSVLKSLQGSGSSVTHWFLCVLQAVAEAIAKERMSIAAFLKAACNQAGQQRPSANGLDHRALNHQSGQRRRHSLDQHEERNGIRSRFGNQNSNQNGHQGGNVNGFQKAPHVAHQGLLQSAEAGGPSSRGWDAEIAGGPRLGSLLGSADHPAATHPDELREGFRRAVGEMPLRTQSQNEIGRVESSISSFFPRVASWGNLSTHSSGSGAGLYNEPMSRGLPTFEPLTTPAGIFSSNKSSDKAGFPSYLASIWSDDKTPNGSPNNHFEQPSLLSNSS